MAITKSKKGGLMSRVTDAIIPAVVGAAVGVVDDAAGTENTEMVGYGALAVGIALPVFVKGTEKVGDSLAAVGGFMASKKMALAEKIGLTDTAGASGLGDRAVMGNTDRMFVNTKRYAENRGPGKPKTDNTNPMG